MAATFDQFPANFRFSGALVLSWPIYGKSQSLSGKLDKFIVGHFVILMCCPCKAMPRKNRLKKTKCKH